MSPQINLRKPEVWELEKWARARSVLVRLQERARTVLMSS